MADGNQVVSYSGNKISLYSPEKGLQRDIAYVRPGDEIDLNFDIRDTNALKVEIVRGDVHIIFSNGSTLTLASLAAIGFSEDAPKIKTLDGKILLLEEFLSITEVLNYNEALLILANTSQIEYSDLEPKIVQVSSDQDADNDAGIPITGQGNTDLLTRGIPSEVVIPRGTVEQVNTNLSKGPFVSTIWTTDYPYVLDKSNYLPGEVDKKDLPNLQITVKYGSQLSRTGIKDINGNEYIAYEFESGLGFTDESTSQLIPNQIREESSTRDLFINNSSENMKYVVNMNYSRGVFPNAIDIIVPKSVDDFFKLEEGSGLSFSSITQTEEGTRYRIAEINPTNQMEFILSFPYNSQIINFDLEYEIKYIDSATGTILPATYTTSLSLYPVTQESHLEKNNGFVLSTQANPVDVVTGTGNDIIIGGGGNNSIRSVAGDNKIFTYGGDDVIDVGRGNNEVWGSAGNSIITGGAGTNTLYYNNKNTGIDPTGNSFKDSYYKTNRLTSGVSMYVGFDADALKKIAGEDFKNSSKITNNTVLISKGQGIDLVTDFDIFYLTRYNDTVTVSDKSNLGNIKIHAYSEENNTISSNKIIIDDSFEDAVIRLGSESTIETSSGSVRVTFTGFKYVIGSKNKETFYGGFFSDSTGNNVDINIDGGSGYAFVTYENLEGGSIDFNANTGLVKKLDSNGENKGVDKIVNVNEIKGTGGSDIYHASFANNYIYSGLSTTDKITYDEANSGVTVVFDDKSDSELYVYKTTEYTSAKDLPSNVHKDTFKGDLDVNNNFSLGKRDDVIIVTDLLGSRVFNGGGGKTTLSYKDLEAGVTVVVNNGVGTISKTGGGTDTFEMLLNGGNSNIYRIIGTEFDDRFEMDDAKGNRYGFSLDGHKGTNTLSYEHLKESSENGMGVSFIISSEGNSTVTRAKSGVVDYFKNFQKFEGSDFNDIVMFSSMVTIDDIAKLEFDFRGGNNNTVNYNLISQSQTNHIEISFEGSDMKVTYSDGRSSVYKNAHGVYGTQGDDIFYASATANMFFDGYQGYNTADYSGVNDDLRFNLHLTTKDNVSKGSDNKDTILNVQHIKGGKGNNSYYLSSSVSYTVEGTEGSQSNVVSYHNSISPITYDLSTNKVTKGSGTNQRTDELINITTVKGSKGDDRFIVKDSMPESKYDLYGNDVWGDNPDKMTNPSNDKDLVDFSAVTNSLDIIFDTTKAGSYNEFDADGNITKEGVVTIEAGSVTFNLYHIEGVIGSSKDDTFHIMSSYGHGGQVNKTRWIIDGSSGYNKVSYVDDSNLSNINLRGTWDAAVQINISNTGVFLSRYYNSGVAGSNIHVEDILTNIQEILLDSYSDSLVTVSSGWEQSSIKKIDAGGRVNNPDSKGNTLSFLGINNDISVKFDKKSDFDVQVKGTNNELPEFINFDNIRLSKGKSTIVFEDGSNFEKVVRITASGDKDSEAILDFTGVRNGITITLGQKSGDNDNINGSSFKGDINIENMGSRFIVLLPPDLSNTVFGSSAKDVDLRGGGNGNNTLSYEKLDSYGITIDYSASKIIKLGNPTVYDLFDGSFKKIVGTSKDDIFLLTTLDVSFASGTVIDLGDKGNNKILIDIQGGVVYDITTTTVYAGGKSLNISPVIGVQVLSFSDKNNDTIKFSASYANSNPKYTKYDGGEGKNTLDFSELDHVIYDAGNYRISQNAVSTSYSNITWDSSKNSSTGEIETLTFNRFYTIIAAKNNTVFYGQARGNFDFVGGSGHDIINYSQTNSNIYIYLLDFKVFKNNNSETVDTFNSNINEILGSTKNDVLVINKIPTGALNVKVDAGVGSNTVKFDLSVESKTHVEIFFDTSGKATFNLVKDGVKTSVNADLVNFESYSLTENDDVIKRNSSVATSIRIDSFGGNDEIIYFGDASITFDSMRGRVARTVNGKLYTDVLNGLNVISYDGGKGKALYKASSAINMTYKGDSTRNVFDTVNYDDAVLDYSSQSTNAALRVDFKPGTNGLMSITKGGSASKDYFDGYITKIIGTKGNDTFILAERNPNLPEIKIEGGPSGNNRVSYQNLANGASFEVDSNGNITIIGGAGLGFHGYKIDSATVNGVELTGGDDIFYGSFETNLDLDGGGGIDLLDYSRLASNIDLIVDFTSEKGTVQKIDTNPGGKVYIDVFVNFEGVKTGDGNSRILIGDRIIAGGKTGSFEVGKGKNNVLDASAMTYGMNLTFGDDYKAEIKYQGIDGKHNYNGFQTIELGTSGAYNEVHYKHSAAYETSYLKFSTLTESGHAFYFEGNASKDMFLDASSDDRTIFVSTTLGGKTFLEIYGFNVIKAKDTSYTLHIEASATSGHKEYWGGNTQYDSIDYSNAVYGLKASMLVDANGQQYIKVVGIDFADAFEDRLYSIENITLSNENDIFEVADITNYSKHRLTVNAGGGTNNEISFVGVKEGKEFEAAEAGNITIEGYTFIGFQTVSLTGGNDIVYFKQEGSSKINANVGSNTADYNKHNTTFTDGVSITIYEQDNVKGFNVLKKGSVNKESDRLLNFNVFILTDKDDNFLYTGSGDNFGLVKMDMGKGRNTVDFYFMDASVENTLFKYDENGLLIVKNDDSGINYEFKNISEIIIGGTKSSLIIEKMSSGNQSVTFNGGDAAFNTALDLSLLKNGTDIVVDISKETAIDSKENLALSFKNFRTINGSTKITLYKMSDMSVSGVVVSYTINTNNTNATIDYNNDGIKGSITVVFDGSKAEVTKAAGGKDQINGGFGHIVGSSFGTTVKINTLWTRDITVDTVESVGTRNVLDFSELSTGLTSTIKLNNASYSEISSQNGNYNARFRNFTEVRGTKGNDTFILNLEGVARDYSGTTITGVTGTNSFVVQGSNLNSRADVEYFSTGTILFTSSINSYGVSLSLNNFNILDFRQADLDILLTFENSQLITDLDYVKGNSAKNNKVYLTRSDKVVDLGEEGIVLDSKTKISDFQNIILRGGSGSDAGANVNVTSIGKNTVVEVQNSTASQTDNLTIETEAKVVLDNRVVKLYRPTATNTSGDNYSFYNFKTVEMTSDVKNLYILDSMLATTVQTIRINPKNGATTSIYFVSDGNLAYGTSDRGVTITVSNTAMSLSLGSNSIAMEGAGIGDFYLGNGNNIVRYDTLTPKIGVGTTYHGGSGYNVLYLDGLKGDTPYGTYLEIRGNKLYLNKEDGSVLLATENFYQVNLAASTPSHVYFMIHSLEDNTNYKLVNPGRLVFSQEMGNSNITSVEVSNNNIIFTSGKGSTVDAIGANTGRALDFLWQGTVNYDIIVRVNNLLPNISPNQPITDNIERGFFAPKAGLNNSGEKVKVTLDVSYMTALTNQDGSYIININGDGDVGDGYFSKEGNNGIIIKYNNNYSSFFYNFNDYIFSNSHNKFTYNQSSNMAHKRIAFNEDWVLQGGANIFTSVDAGNQSNYLSLKNGYIVVDNTTNFTHTWYGVSNFNNFTNVRFDLSEEYHQSSRSFDTNKVLPDQITYTMTNERGTIYVSEVKNNTVIDTRSSGDNILFMGRAAFYDVQQFQDEYIVVGEKKFKTGGSYLVITDDNGNKMYILNVNFDDIMFGGNIIKKDEDGNPVSSGYAHASENYDTNIPVANEHYNDSHKETTSSDNNDWISVYRNNPVFGFEEDLSFDLVEDEGLDLVSNDEIDLDNITDDLVSNDEIDLDNVNDDLVSNDEIDLDNVNYDLVSNDEIDLDNVNDDLVSNDEIDLDNVNYDLVEENAFDNISNQEDGYYYNISQAGVSEEFLLDVINQTFSREDDSLDAMDLNLDTEIIDLSSINENLVEETIIQESDIDNYKLESERNEDGTLKINNGSNGTGGLGSF